MLELENIRKVFNPGTPNEIPALDNISITIEPGSFVIIIGTDGSGRSTLQNLISGNTFADSGKVYLDGLDITRMPEYKRARRIGRVLKNPFSGTASNMTIAENLALALKRCSFHGPGLLVKNSNREYLKKQVSKLNLGLENCLNAKVGTLSSGQRQALTLLMATMIKPRLLLLDEHTAELDPKTADMVIRLTHDVVSRDKLTTLMVTPSLHQAIHLGDRLIMMHRGKIIYDISNPLKRRLKVDDLQKRFEKLRRIESLDASTASMLENLYI